MAALSVRQVVSPCRLLQKSPQTLCRSQPHSVASPYVGCPKKEAPKSVPTAGAIRLSALQTLAAWGGKSHMGSTSFCVVKGKQGARPLRGLVTASLFGVGAPEALVIGVVALLVFGPKGLAEVARNLGKTLKTFQPTIKELQDVSREFRSTLEQEIGLDDLRDPYRGPPPPPLPPQESAKPAASETGGKSKEEDRPSPKAYTTDEMLRVTEEQAKQLVSEEKRKAAEAAAWGGQVPATKKEDGSEKKAQETAKVGSPKEPQETAKANGPKEPQEPAKVGSMKESS